MSILLTADADREQIDASGRTDWNGGGAGSDDRGMRLRRLTPDPPAAASADVTSVGTAAEAPGDATAEAPETTNASAAAEPHPEPVPALPIPLPHGRVEDVAGLLVGCVLASFGLFVLKAGGVVTGGTAGVALLISYASGWMFPVLFLLVNLPFFVLAIRRRGWGFSIRSLLSIVAVSSLAAAHAALWPHVELPPIYAAVLGNALAGVGLLVLFRHKSSIGGFGILALIAQDALGWRAGWVLLVLDAIVLLVSLTVMPPLVILVSTLGAIILNGIISLNHRPGRYTGS